MQLSIIIPVYNSAPYLERCLDSCIQQSINENDYEIICINDGSTDNSLDIIEKYQKKHQNIVCITQKNQGQSAARNKGLSIAQGEYLFFVDSDDFVKPYSLHICLQEAKVKQLDILTHGIGEFSIKAEENSYNISRTMTGMDYIATYNYNNGAWGYLIQKSFLLNKEISFITGRYCEDGLFTLSCFLKARSMAHINLNVYRYIIRPGSTVSNRTLNHIKKTVDDYFYAAQYYDIEINKVFHRLSDTAKSRLLSRRDSYTFFGLLRLTNYCARMDASLSKRISLLKQHVSILKEKGLYPPKHFISKDYTLLKFKILTFIVSHSITLFLLMMAQLLQAKIKHGQ